MASCRISDVITKDWVCAECETECGVLQTLHCGHVMCLACLEKGGVNKMETMSCTSCQPDQGSNMARSCQPDEGSNTAAGKTAVQDYNDNTSDYGTMMPNLGDLAADDSVAADGELQCDVCGKPDPTQMCPICINNFCEDCGLFHCVKHSHKLVTRSATTLCFQHQQELKTLYCKSCGGGICEFCFDESHADHQVVTVQAVLEEKKQQLLTFKEKSATVRKSASELDFEHAVKSLDETYSVAEAKLLRIQEQFNAKFEELKGDLHKQHAKECGKIKLFENQTEDSTTLLEFHTSNVEKTLSNKSEADIVAVADQLSSLNIKAPHQNLPEISKPMIDETDMELIELKTLLRFESSKLEMKKKENNHEKNNGKKACEMMWCSEINCATGAVIYDDECSIFWVRTSDQDGRLWKYNLEGDFLGKYLQTSEQLGGICMDTKRHLLLVTLSPDVILAFDRNGKEIFRITVNGAKFLAGIAYLPDKDWYGLSDYTKNCLWFVSAESQEPVKQIGTKKSAQGLLVEPTFLSYGTVIGTEMPSLFVIDRSTHHLKEFALNGTVLNRYSMEGKHKYLSHPLGICLDFNGKLLICDRDKGRVGRFFQKGTTKFWRVMLTGAQLDGMTPISVCVTRQGHLAVTAAMFNRDNKIQPPCHLYLFTCNV